MPGKARKETIDESRVGIHHCYNRTVRQLPVLDCDSEDFDGFDGDIRDIFSNLKNREDKQRGGWVRSLLRLYAGYFAIDVLDYALMSNHFHFLLRNRPDIVAGWTDREVVERWLHICPQTRDKDGKPRPPTELAIDARMKEAPILRGRLSSISWFMRLVSQRISLRANKEDGCSGHFFADRFKSRELTSEADVLNCSLYIDLNAIRAGKAKTPESSIYTSAFDRILSRWSQSIDEIEQDDRMHQARNADAWLAPVFLDERACAYTGPAERVGQANLSEGAGEPNVNAYNPIGAPRVSNKGYLSITTKSYLELLDAVGRIARAGKASIPKKLPPIMKRLRIKAGEVLGAFSYFDTMTPSAAISEPGGT